MSGTISRIVVALDAVSENRAAIVAAVRLAAQWNAPVHGVFVEDDDLLRLAVLPFARQVTLGFGVEALDVTQAERQLRAYAERARRDLAEAARASGIEWSFEIVRDTTVGVAAAATDFLVAGISTRPIDGHFRMQCRWWSVIEPSPASFLLAREGRLRGTIVGLLQRRGPDAERLLAVAAQLAETAEARLTVIGPPELAGEEGFAAWLSQILAGHRVQVEISPTLSTPEALIRQIGELDCRLLAIAADAAPPPEQLRDLVARISCDVLVVR
ncbi:MAG TPA: hypothetical protein VET89_12310 [Stellaceae bacterium]|jgi:hypothetical protein|nr:hypothetical protein [Stellaceae bacterium]